MYELGEKLTTKKKHPCGGDVWTVIRTGADYKLKCDKCGRVVMVAPTELEKMLKKTVKKTD